MPSLRRPRVRLSSLVIDPTPLREDRDYRLLWVGQAISAMGRHITMIVLPYQVYVLTGDILQVGLLSIVQLIPILVFTLGGGAIADTVDRRRLLLVTQAGLMLCALALAGLAMLEAPPLLAIYAVAFVAAGVGSVDQPARASSIARLVPPEHLPAAFSLNQVMFNASAVIGPAIGGIVLATVGIAAAYLLDVVSFVAALVTLLLMHPIPPTAGGARASLSSVLEGLRFARSRRELLANFVVDLNAMVFGSPKALYPALALDVFRVGPAGVGFMAAAAGAGALFAAFFTGWTGRVERPGRAVLVAVAVWGAAIVGFGLAVFSFPLALLFLAIAHGADVVSAVLRSTMLQVLSPDALRGRVSSIHTLVVTGGPRVGDLEAAAVAAVIGPTGAVITGGVLCLIGLGIIDRRMPEYADLELRLDQAEAVA